MQSETRDSSNTIRRSAERRSQNCVSGFIRVIIKVYQGFIRGLSGVYQRFIRSLSEVCQGYRSFLKMRAYASPSL
eukprot:749444-Prorocentrum_minimum.AAC.1